MRRTRLSILFVLLLSTFSVLAAPAGAKAKARAPKPAAAPALPAQLVLGHQLDEESAERLEPLIEQFNSQNKEVQISLARRVAGEAPKHINLVTTEEQLRFTDNKARFRPLHELMRAAKEPFDAAKLSPELRDGLVDGRGRLMALPLAFSTPVLYINKEAFRKARLDPENPPKTWLEMQEVAGQLFEAGERCPFTTSWPTWTFIDNVSTWNGVDVSDNKGKLTFNGLVQVKHLAMMASWHKAKYLHLFGHRDEADRRFANGECAMLTSNSSLFTQLNISKQVDAGASTFPYHDDVYGAPKNTLADGAALWFSADLKPAEVKGAAKFVNYVLGPEIQIRLTLAGGFLPITPVARATASSKLLQSDLYALQAAYSQLQGKTIAPKVRPSQIAAVRTILDEELDAVWANRKPAKEALDSAAQRANAALNRPRKKRRN
ncbi:MAG: extracellular solute-binding protein [Propionivibrio sp.]|jgi:sn-glycerol 3-phosphate transport system substrate-binding protein|nr:extracellular solute-binding protein [Propionivibrio sp.]